MDKHENIQDTDGLNSECAAVSTDTENAGRAEKELTEKEKIARIKELRKQDYLEKVDECRKVYVEKRGKDHGDIELEMRGRWWPTFSRRCLYRDGARPGWPERFGWNEELSKVKVKKPRLSVEGPCVNRFHRWLKRVSPGYNWDWPHIKLLVEKLQAVADGKTKRLMIFMPPRHGNKKGVSRAILQFLGTQISRIISTPKFSHDFPTPNTKDPESPSPAKLRIPHPRLRIPNSSFGSQADSTIRIPPSDSEFESPGRTPGPEPQNTPLHKREQLPHKIARLHD